MNEIFINDIIQLSETEITLSPSVEKIVSSTFLSNHYFDKLIIPPTVKSLDVDAFKTRAVQNISVHQDNLEYMSIDGVLFSKKNLSLLYFPPSHPTSEYVIPSNIVSIESDAFNDCLNLTSIIIPSSVSSISYEAFQSLPALQKILVDPGNQHFVSLNGILFSKDLRRIIRYPCELVAKQLVYEIPSTVQLINNYAFLTSQLEQIIIPPSVTSIGQLAFANCRSLANLIIPPSVTSIGEAAFAGCSELETIKILANISSIGPKSFLLCQNLIHVELSSSIKIIKKNAFQNCRNLTTIKLSENLETIEDYGFFFCQNLKLLYIPPKLTSIGYSAFSYTPSIEEIVVDSNNPKYYSSGKILYQKEPHSIVYFANTNKVEHYVIPEGIVSIGVHAFAHCSTLKTITLASTVAQIGEKAFMSCHNLETVTIPAGVTSIGKSLFLQSSKLKQIIVDPNNKHFISIDNILFSKDMEEIICYPPAKAGVTYTIPSCIKVIKASAFAHCTNLIKIRAPSSLTTIEENAFTLCYNMKSLEFASPSQLTSIGQEAFRDCQDLEFLVIPKGVTSIGDFAFQNCFKLTSIVIPSTITSFGHNIFFKALKIQTISILASDNESAYKIQKSIRMDVDQFHTFDAIDIAFISDTNSSHF